MMRSAACLPLLLLSLGFPAGEGFILRPVNPPVEERYRETMLPADVDKDGDMDFFSGESRGSPTWWFERRPEGWKRRPVSDSNVADVGGVAMDVDGDGWIDKLTSGLWYRNPGFPAGGLADSASAPPFGICRYSSLQYLHDIYPADFDGNGRMDVLTIHSGGIFWFRAPPPDSACGEWEERAVIAYPEPRQDHGGIAAGDLDGDGDPDVSRMDRWYENADGKGGAWIEHADIPLDPVRPGYWGLAGRALIADVDGDGHNDLVEAECDLANGRIFWFSNQGGKGLAWEPHLIKDSVDGQDFHSLILRDFDGDGDSDLFSAGAGSSAAEPKAYLWENLDGKGGSWREHALPGQGLQFHDAAGADMDGDGDIDILSNDWATGAQFYLANQRFPDPGAGLHRSVGGARPKLRKAPAHKAAFPHRGLWRGADGRSLEPAR